jgi:hypothetical protein
METLSTDTAELFAPPTDLIMVTAPFVSGHHITRVIGMTFGLIVRSRGLAQNIYAYFRAWGGRGDQSVYPSLGTSAPPRTPAAQRPCKKPWCERGRLHRFRHIGDGGIDD